MNISPLKTNWTTYDHAYHILSFLFLQVHLLSGKCQPAEWPCFIQAKKKCKTSDTQQDSRTASQSVALMNGPPTVIPNAFLHDEIVKAPCFFSEVKVAKKHRSVKYINQFFHFCWWFRNPGTRLSSCYGRQCLNPPFLWLSTWLFSEKPADFVYDGFLLRFLLRTATPTRRTARTADRTHPPPCENVGVQTVEEWDCFSIFFNTCPNRMKMISVNTQTWDKKDQTWLDPVSFWSDWNFCSLRKFGEGKFSINAMEAH